MPQFMKGDGRQNDREVPEQPVVTVDIRLADIGQERAEVHTQIHEARQGQCQQRQNEYRATAPGRPPVNMIEQRLRIGFHQINQQIFF